MGGSWVPELESSGPVSLVSLGATPASTAPEDTARLVGELVEAGVDAILYAGGDGTTRDIVNALEAAGDDAPTTALIGVPGGVKMHSGCFATTPKAAAEVALSFALGDLRTAITEVMDLDETVYAKGEWKVRMYGEAWTPSSPRFMQGAKEQVERVSEEDTIEGLAHHVKSLLEDEPDLMVVWGSGGTLRRMGEHLDLELTLLGIDVQHKEVVHHDLNEQGLLEGDRRTSTKRANARFFFSCRRWAGKASSSAEGTCNSRPMCSEPSVIQTSSAWPRPRSSSAWRRFASIRGMTSWTPNFKPSASSKSFRAFGPPDSFEWLNFDDAQPARPMM